GAAPFFFQAEDGIRDFHVTGVQTCALPIYLHQPGRGAPAVLVDEPAFFDTAEPYAPTARDPIAHGIRFALFSRAVVDYARRWGAEVVHANDWPTGLVPVFARVDRLGVPTVFGIHNL